jgi:uncharacterized Zn-binding protein involved in type VI secretion
MPGFPASRVGDMHICPAVTVLVPHVGGPVLPPCAITVITCNMPQARVLDMLTCVGPPDVISMGASTVIVCGTPAARITDQTLHGGKLIMGCPTVIIGDPSANATAQAAVVAAHPNGSTRVYVDPITHTVFISTNLEYTGSGANQAMADASKQAIENTWGRTLTYQGQNYNVTMLINTKVNPAGPATPGYDQILVNDSTKRADQTLYGDGPGHQPPNSGLNPLKPLSPAHEYGHTLGLDDDYTDTPTGSVPKPGTPPNNIMSSTWPDPATGTMPYPHQSHYDQVMQNHGY